MLLPVTTRDRFCLGLWNHQGTREGTGLEDTGSLLRAAWLVAWLLWLSNLHGQLCWRCLSILSTHSLSPDTWVETKYPPIHPQSPVHQSERDSGVGLVLPSPSLHEATCSYCRCVWSSFEKQGIGLTKPAWGPVQDPHSHLIVGKLSNNLWSGLQTGSQGPHRYELGTDPWL